MDEREFMVSAPDRKPEYHPSNNGKVKRKIFWPEPLYPAMVGMFILMPVRSSRRLIMLQFKVSGMTCGGCVASVKRAVKMECPSAAVEIDLSAQVVKVDVVEDPAKVARLIEGAGFPVLEETILR